METNITDEEDEAKWDELFKKHPEPLRESATFALAEHRAGRSEPMKFD